MALYHGYSEPHELHSITFCDCMLSAAAEMDLMADVTQDEAEMGVVPRMRRLLDSVRKALYVMGSCLLVFAAARNSFHW